MPARTWRYNLRNQQLSKIGANRRGAGFRQSAAQLGTVGYLPTYLPIPKVRLYGLFFFLSQTFQLEMPVLLGSASRLLILLVCGAYPWKFREKIYFELKESGAYHIRMACSPSSMLEFSPFLIFLGFFFLLTCFASHAMWQVLLLNQIVATWESLFPRRTWKVCLKEHSDGDTSTLRYVYTYPEYQGVISLRA